MFGGVAGAGVGDADEVGLWGPGGRVLPVDQDGYHVVWAWAEHKPGSGQDAAISCKAIREGQTNRIRRYMAEVRRDSD